MTRRGHQLLLLLNTFCLFISSTENQDFDFRAIPCLEEREENIDDIKAG